MVKAQEWLDHQYPQWHRKEVTNLDLNQKELEGSLKLENFVNLKRLNCGNNKLTQLELIDCPKIEELLCYRNEISYLNVGGCPNLKTLMCSDNLIPSFFVYLDLSKNTELKFLNISNNSFDQQDLSPLSHLVNLERLWLKNGSDMDVMNNRIYKKRVKRVSIIIL